MRPKYTVEMLQTCNPPRAGPGHKLGVHPGAGSGVGEGGGADLHRLGAGDHQLGSVPPAGHPADADDRQLGQRLADVVHGADGERMDRPPR